MISSVKLCSDRQNIFQVYSKMIVIDSEYSENIDYF